ncbi:penicillin-binding transpeptidase domain-containing protein, partial [Streptomyces rhizosphaericus]
DGAVLSAVAPDGRERRLVRVPDQDGDPLRTTLDEDLQLLAEDLLADVGPASALVALRPSDGAVLAAASGPGADGLNVATYGQYAPGSTFKIVSSLALLRGGLTPSSTVPCTPTVTVDGRVFENYDDYPTGSLGDVPLRTAVAQSCNTAMIAERDRPGPDGVATAAAALGLGVDRDLGF